MKIILKVLKIFFVLENMLRSIFRKIIILLNIMFSVLQAFIENLIENVDSRFFGSGVDFYERVNQRWERLGDSD